MRIDLLSQFEEMVNRHQREIVSFHYRLVGNKPDAEDLAQQTFIKAYKNFETVKDQEKVRSWLYKIARNVTVDFYRKNSGKREIPLDDSILEYYNNEYVMDHEAELVSSEISRELVKCIAQLRQEERMVVKLLYYEGFSYKEMAEMLNINQNTLKSRLHRARHALLEIIRCNPVLKDLSLEI